jgi:hypothetical protein
MGEHGGKRAGAGRKSVATLASIQREWAAKAEQYKAATTPMEYMAAVMMDENADPKRRDEMAKALAPYVHQKLAQREVGIKALAQADAETAGVGSDWEEDLQFNPSKAN